MDRIDIPKADLDALKALRAEIDAIIEGPPSRADGLMPAVERFKSLRDKLATVGKATITAGIKAFMAEHPEVESLRFRAYTPYWNDGDECTYRVRDPSLRLVGARGDEGDYEDGYQDRFDLSGGAVTKPLGEALGRLGDVLRNAEDAVKATFGDHVQVTVGRDGNAEVEQYEHD